jgi:DNA-binding LacI/PurR family transcriptional regulator
MARIRAEKELPSKPAILKDVALRAGVDASTVSRVLRGDDRRPAKAETRDRILQIAREMGYTPNGVARSLRTRRTEAIGVVVPDVGNPAVAQIFGGIQRAASAAGRYVIVIDGGTPARPDLGWERLAFEGRVDGLLVLTARVRDPTVLRVARSGVPVVLVNRRSEGIAGSVVMDDARGAQIAVDHLAELGHRRIAHVTGPTNIDTAQRRLAGFRAAMRAHALPLREAWIVAADHTESGGAEAARALLATPNRPTAVYVASFLAGIGATHVFREAELRVPEDISVVISDELTLAAHIAPPLTTVRMPLARMGEVAAIMLMHAVAGEPVTDIVLADPPELVIRNSTGPPPLGA